MHTNPAPSAIPLDQLSPGREGVIESVQVPGALGERLLDLGFEPGTPVRVMRRAPLGDPTLYELRGTQLCLRRGEAAGIRVRPQGTE